MLKIHAKILPLNIFKNIFSHLKFKLKILKKIQNLRADVLKHFVLYNSLLKKSFFSQTRPWANKSKILSAGLPEANRIVFEK